MHLERETDGWFVVVPSIAFLLSVVKELSLRIEFSESKLAKLVDYDWMRGRGPTTTFLD